MPLDNLAKVFAPTLIGNFSNDLDTHQVYAETMIQVSIMTNLLGIPGQFWNQYTNTNVVGASSSSEPERDIGQTPDTGSTESHIFIGQNPKYYTGKLIDYVKNKKSLS